MKRRSFFASLAALAGAATGAQAAPVKSPAPLMRAVPIASPDGPWVPRAYTHSVNDPGHTHSIGWIDCGPAHNHYTKE